MADILTAIQTLSTKLIPNSTGDKRIVYTARLRDYSQRLLDQVLPPLVLEFEEDEATVPDPLSSDPITALSQILTATGHPFTVNPDGTLATFTEIEAVIADATPEQIQQIALIGFFGSTGSRSDVDYSLRQQFYDQDPDGNEAPKPEYADGGTWPAYLKTIA